MSLDKTVFASFSVDITQLVYAKVTAACEMNVAWPGGGGTPMIFSKISLTSMRMLNITLDNPLVLAS